MRAYQFYCLDERGNDHLIGILPERRFDPDRITDGSIVKWATEAMGSGLQGRRIRFLRVNLAEGDEEIRDSRRPGGRTQGAAEG
jgi:hypothetical protein